MSKMAHRCIDQETTMSRSMNIGEAADAAGVSAKMIRHYEQIGLLPEAARTESGYRQYSERDVSVLRFIRQSRRLGFSMEQIAGLLGLWSNQGRAAREVKALAQEHLDALEEKMREIAEMQAALKGLVQACHGGDKPDCAILQQLAIASPVAPAPRAVSVHPVRKAKARAVANERPKPVESTSHADLMAWTRSARAVHQH
jgi:Cu(I)-responsive transcriptional regulator